MASSESRAVLLLEFVSPAERTQAPLLPFPSLPESFQPAISYSSRVPGVHGRHTRLCVPLLLCDIQFRADVSPLEASGWLLWVFHHVVSGQSNFGQETVCGFRI